MKGGKKGVALLFALLLALMRLHPGIAHADGPEQPIRFCSEYDKEKCATFVFQALYNCYGLISSECENIVASPIDAENAYIPQVLSNEWDSRSGPEALKAGAVAIRTFARRNIGGCGAIHCWKYSGVDDYCFPVENSWAQHYWLDASQGTGQNDVLDIHLDAGRATRGLVIRRASDSHLACARYRADCGNPTKADPLEPATLQSISDPVDTNNVVGPQAGSGMSQNGTAAWNRGSAPWDHLQMLTHYYSNILLPGTDPSYRWTWLDVGPDIVFTGYSGEQYRGPISLTPTEMEIGRTYSVPFHIQNTGTIPWPAEGSFPVHLSYHWYDELGNVVVWDGLRTSLPYDISPGQDVTLTAMVQPPSYPGTYVLKWDMVQENIAWFSWRGWRTQDIAVAVRPPSTPLPTGCRGDELMSFQPANPVAGQAVTITVTSAQFHPCVRLESPETSPPPRFLGMSEGETYIWRWAITPSRSGRYEYSFHVNCYDPDDPRCDDPTLSCTACAIGYVTVSQAIPAPTPTPTPSLIYVDGALGSDGPDCGLAPGSQACRSIGYALENRATPGDTVQVAAGVYTETIALKAGVRVIGAGSLATVINGAGSGPVVRATGSDVGPDTVLSGFTITGGEASFGGGVYIAEGASPLIQGNAIEGNVAERAGGGIYVGLSSSPHIIGNEVKRNRANGNGGGVSVSGGSSVVLEGNVIEDNEAYHAGGGIYSFYSSLTLKDNVVRHNRAAWTGGGLYVYYHSSATLDGDMVVGNQAESCGGIDLDLGSLLSLSGSVISHNSAMGTGGICVRGKSSLTAHGNAICGNANRQLLNETFNELDLVGNWWGTNEPGLEQIQGPALYRPGIVMSIGADPPGIHPGGFSRLVVRMSNGGYRVPDGLAIYWDSSQGHVSPLFSYTFRGEARALFRGFMEGAALVTAWEDCGYSVQVAIAISSEAAGSSTQANEDCQDEGFAAIPTTLLHPLWSLYQRASQRAMR